MVRQDSFYQDTLGKKYTIENIACVAGLGKITNNVHILYEDGSKAVFSEDVHLKHRRLGEAVQSLPEATKPKLSLEEATKNSMSVHNFIQHTRSSFQS